MSELPVVQWRNAVRLDADRIDCEIEHPKYGWIPFTASAADIEEHGRLIYAEIAATLPPPA